MFRRWIRVLLLFVLMIPVATAGAQQPPPTINDALADLSARLGREIRLADLLAWRWVQDFYPDTSLGCPAPGQTYPRQQTLGTQFLFTTWDSVTYDYRASVDGSVLVLCVDGRPADAPPGVEPAPGVLPPTVDLEDIAPAIAGACDFEDAHADYLLPRLSVGIEARKVNDGIRMNVRREPSQQALIVTQIPSGGRMTVIDGPLCGTGLVWWKVRYNNLEGWAAEGSGNSYWLEPLAVVAPVVEVTPAVEPGVIAAANADEVTQLTALTAADPLSSNVVFSPDGELVAAGDGTGTVRIWETATGQALFELAAHEGEVTALAFNGEGDLLASGGAEGVVRLWDVAQGQEQAELSGHEAAITALAFGRDGTLLASASADATVRLWDVSTGAGLSIITAHTAEVIGLVFNTEGTVLVTASADGDLRLWGLRR